MTVVGEWWPLLMLDWFQSIQCISVSLLQSSIYNFSKKKIKKLNGNMNSLVGSKDIKPVDPSGASTNILC